MPGHLHQDVDPILLNEASQVCITMAVNVPVVIKQDTQAFGRCIWMAYTANTRDGASCIALSSTDNLLNWEDHGPILIGPADGYEPRLEGGHRQGSLESCMLITKNDRWYLLVNGKLRDHEIRNWVFESDRMDSFELSTGREFWRGAGGIESLHERGSISLLATFSGGRIRLGEVDWSQEKPTADFVPSAERLERWTT